MKKPTPYIKKLGILWHAAGKICMFAGIAINVLCLLVWVEIISQNSHSMAMIWAMEQTPFLLMSGALLMLITTALVFLLGRAAPAVCLVNTLIWLMAGINRVKLSLRGDPFQFSDLTMAGEAFAVVINMLENGLPLTTSMFIGFLLLVILAPLAFCGVRVMQKKRMQRFLCAVALCVLCIPCLQRIERMESQNTMVIQDDYAKRGFLFAFVDGLLSYDNRGNVIEKPLNYSQEAVAKSLASVSGETADPEILPDILFVMSESLFDMADQFDLTEEPMPYFKQLQQQYWGGEFMTTGYGGGTANVEYEVLTGYRSMDTAGYSFNIAGGTIRKGMDSMISLLKEHGYYTEAIHPNSGAYYDRQNVYTTLGFDQTRFEKELDPVPPSVLSYPSDDYLFDQIIRAYEERPSDRPWFCHSVTYQNHVSYAFKSDFSAIGVNDLPEKADDALSIHNYVNMIRLSDDALRKLVAYFETQERPVVIVVWGDHAPAFHLFGKSLPSSPEALMRYYTTPYMIWNNYGADFSMLPKKLSAYRLGAGVLTALGMEDTYFRYLALPQTIDLTLLSGLSSQEGQFVRDPDLYEQERKKLLMLHYDRLLGENYGEGL